LNDGVARRYVIGLGANLGDRFATLREAARQVEDLAKLNGCSSLYETAPVGLLDQPLFLNAALDVQSDLAPHSMLTGLLRIERELGRVRDADTVRWGPRAIDLDILWIDGVVIDDERLTVPHPRLAERAFALHPLLELVPDALDPRTQRPYVRLSEDGMRRIEGALL
jgi:2-amino-4-hydroxy-6-hydroxymethyldihydropteridine diphosphokinase